MSESDLPNQQYALRVLTGGTNESREIRAAHLIAKQYDNGADHFYYSRLRPLWIGFDRQIEESDFREFHADGRGELRIVQTGQALNINRLRHFDLWPVNERAFAKVADDLLAATQSLAFGGQGGLQLSTVSRPLAPQSRWLHKRFQANEQSRLVLQNQSEHDSALEALRAALNDLKTPVILSNHTATRLLGNEISTNANPPQSVPVASTPKNPPTSPRINWIDLSALECHIGTYRHPSGKAAFALVDMHGDKGDMIRKAGFEPCDSHIKGADIYFLPPGRQFTLRDLKQHFPADSVKVINAEANEITESFQKAFRAKVQINAEVFFKQRQPLGWNPDGYMVFSSPVGRVAEDPKNKTKDGQPIRFAEHTRTIDRPIFFLHAMRGEDIRELAKTFIAQIFHPKHPIRHSRESYDRFVSITNAGNHPRRTYDENMEAASLDILRDQLARLDDDAPPLASFDVAQRLYDGMPPLTARTGASVALQQYSTPSPIAVLSQRLLGTSDELKEAHVLEPTIGNGSLVSTMIQSHVYGVEIDPERLKRLPEYVRTLQADATDTAFRHAFDRPSGFDFVIANPPFGDTGRAKQISLPAGSPEASMPIRRLDQQIMLAALHSRKPEGRAVFITGADNAFGNGDIEGTSRYVLNYLHDCYEGVEVVDIAGEMYSKQGAAYPIRLYVIDERKSIPEIVHDQPGRIPEKLPVIRSYPDLKLWAEGVLSRRDEREIAIRADQLLPKESATTPTQESSKNDDRSENEYQIPYVAFSKVSDPTTMIPANLSGVIYEALNEIRNQRGDIDEYVGRELELTVAQLMERFVAEQVDALAMIFDAQDSRKGFLLADRMGVGKGRVLAAAAVYAHSKGQVPVFFSVTSNLFTDLLERDIADIGFRDRFKNVLILNGDAKTLDANGNVSVKPPPPARLNAMFAEQQLPRGTDLVMLTYSQVSRETGKSKKADFLANIAAHTPLALLLDESHNAAGESFTSTNIQRMIDANSQHGAVLYASATPIKGAKNLAVYSKILPAGVNVDPDELLKAVQADPLSLQEALMHEIAQQGSTVCRSLDDSNLQMEFRLSPRAEQHRVVADQFSYIMQAMCYLSGDVAKIVDERNKEFEKELAKIPAEEREGQRMTSTSLNFASRLYNVNRQFLMALQADDVLEYTITELKADRKPVITIQATGESLLNDFVGTGNEAAQELTGDAGKKAKKQTFNDVLLDKPITFSDLLRKYLDRISYITTQTGYGNYSVTPCISDEFIESRDRIAKMIDDFPELPMTPIDYLRTKLQEKGYSMGEVSGRNLQVDYLPTGGLRIYKRPDAGDKTAVNRIVKSFNNGDTDVLLLTGAGSTGLSAHASPSVGSDIRPRVMIKLELQAAIDKEVQIGGRINRRGQVTPPTYVNPLSGLPAQDRLMMMFNAKSRNLSSSSEANRDSKDIIREAPDLLNVVGDEAAQTLLFDNRELAEALDIKLPEAEESHRQGPLWYANKLSSRISLVPVARQEAIYAEWQSRFTDLLERYKADGRNPLEVKVYDWKAQRISRSVFHGEAQAADNKSRSMLEMPVYLTTLRYDQVMTPLNASQVDLRIEANRAAVNMHPMVDPVSGGVPDITHYLIRQRDQLLRDSVAKRFSSLEQALEDKDPNAAKEMAAKLDWLETNLPRLRLGAVFYQNDIHGNEQPNVVVRFTPPSKPEHFTRLSEYTLYTVQPGHDSLDLRYLSSLQTQALSFQRLDFSRNSVAREIFDTAPAGVVPRTARILDGNLFEAVNINLRQHVGHKIVYTAINPDTGKSEKHHGILVNSGISDRQLEAIPERVRDQQTLLRLLLESEKPVTTRPDGDAYHKDTPLAFFPAGDRGSAVVISVPAEKSKGGKFYTDPAISRIPGKEEQNLVPLLFERSVNRMVAHVRTADLPILLNYLITERGTNFYVRAEHLKPLRDEQKKTVQHQAPGVKVDAATLEL